MSISRFIDIYSGVLYYALAISILTIIVIYRKWYILDKKNLFRQKLFWLSVGVPLISFIYFGIFSWWGKTPVLSAHGYARFYEISKFPLLLLASSVPLASIVNNIHRTIQTEAQIEAAESKNAIDRHLAHEKNFIEKAKELLLYDIRNAVNTKGDLKCYEFKDSFEVPEDTEINLLKRHTLKVTNPYLLYSQIYNKSTINSSSDYTPNIEFLKKIEVIFKTIDDNLNLKTSPENLTSKDYIEKLNSISYNIALILDMLNVECTSNLRIELQKENISMVTFTPHEIVFTDILEATYYIAKKLIPLVYGVELQNYRYIHNYLYTDNSRFHFDTDITNAYDFYSPEWKSYTSPIHCIHSYGDKLAAEH